MSRSLKKGIGRADDFLACKIPQNLGNVDSVTVMMFVRARGDRFTPVIMYPAKQPHFRKLCNGSVQLIQDGFRSAICTIETLWVSMALYLTTEVRILLWKRSLSDRLVAKSWSSMMGTLAISNHRC